MRFYCTFSLKILFIRIFFLLAFFFIIYVFFLIQLYHSILGLLRIKLYNFYNLVFMRLFQYHDSDCKFNGLTRLTQVFFSLFLINFFFQFYLSIFD